MTWVLVLFLTLDGETRSMPVGHMIDATFCHMAGSQMARAIMAVAPGSQVGWTCTPIEGVLS